MLRTLGIVFIGSMIGQAALAQTPVVILPGPATQSPEAGPVALELSELDEVRAAADTHVDIITDQDLTAVNSGNTITADSVSSGNIQLTSGALSGYNGVGNFVMNTGHNNNLQGTISVTIVNTSDLTRP